MRAGAPPRGAGGRPRPGRRAQHRDLAEWWPLAALLLLAAALRLATLDLQSFWYDEASRPCTCCTRASWATLHAVVHTENTPPLWYVLIWGVVADLRHGRVALRLPSALAGMATVAVAWGIGRELTGTPARRRSRPRRSSR